MFLGSVKPVLPSKSEESRYNSITANKNYTFVKQENE